MLLVGLVLLVGIGIGFSFASEYYGIDFRVPWPWLADAQVVVVGVFYVGYLTYMLIAIERERTVTPNDVRLLLGMSAFLIGMMWLYLRSG